MKSKRNKQIVIFICTLISVTLMYWFLIYSFGNDKTFGTKEIIISALIAVGVHFGTSNMYSFKNNGN